MTATLAIQESVCTFGGSTTLTGVYTPANDENSTKPCALYLTAGLLHHIGPTRLHVEMARELSSQGVAGLRFDLSGAGDSETGSLGGYFVDRSVEEVKQAMSYLEAHHGHKQFVLIGLCSGADDALATALKDERVAGIVLLNGYAYQAGQFAMHRALSFYLPRLFMWEKLRNRLTKLISKETEDVRKNRAALTELDDDFRYIPPQKDTETNLHTLSDAKTDMLFVYTGSEHEDYTYEGQRLQKTHVSERFLKEADHTLILKKDRIKVIGWVSDWFNQSLFQRAKP